MAKKLTRYILIALVLGIIAGWAINSAIDDGTPASAERLKSIADYLSIVTTLVPAPDQDDHRASGLLDPGRGHRAHGRCRRARPRRHALARLVHPREPRLADARPDPRHRAPSRRRPQPRDPARDRRRAASRPPRSTSRTSSRTSCPQSIFEAMSTNEILPIVIFSLVLRGRAHGDRRGGQADRPRSRSAGPGDAPGHRLCDALRALRGVHRRRQRARRARPADHRHARASSSAASISASPSCGRC